MSDRRTTAKYSRTSPQRLVEWTRSQSERLCELYESESCLYEPDHPRYYNRKARSEAWSRIEAQLDIPAVCCREKMENMRTQYVRYIKEIALGEHTAEPHWLVDKLQFLERHIKPKSLGGEHLEGHSLMTMERGESNDMIGEEAAWILEDVQRQDSSPNDQSSLVMSAHSEDAVLPTVLLQSRKRLANGTRRGLAVRANTARSMESYAARGLPDSYNLTKVKVENTDWEAQQIEQPTQQLSAADDVHEAFGRYIASELRCASAASPRSVIACKQDMYKALARMQDAVYGGTSCAAEGRSSRDTDDETNT